MTNASPIADADYYMRLLVDRVPTMLAYWDRDLICRFANRAYEAWFGADPDRLLGTRIQDLLGPQLFEMNYPFMLKALAGERQVFERVVPGPGGVQRQSLAEYIPDTVNGEVRGFLVQVTNVTELKETQAALQRETALRAELERRTVQLQTALQERTEMLNVLAHEVRQPLNNASAALQSAQGALRKQADDVVSGRVEQAQQVLGEVLGSIDNTLAVATLLARPDPVDTHDVDIAALTSITIADLPANERHRVQVYQDPHLRTGTMDMSLMRLALRNLLSNALKFSPSGSPVVLRISETEDPPALHLAVSDTGPGIEDEVLPRLFSRGAHGRSSRGAHGLGLGLYIVDRVMALHQGTARLQSTGAQGTTFELVLPQMLVQGLGLPSKRASVSVDQSP
ncbi:MAG: PAS domain S-box protein [Burkholderiales bacterium]|nr:MAG: PAS domain S-box protein [Burkholderiales bacterium]